MKTVNMLSKRLLVAGLVVFVSCNSGEDKKPAADSTPTPVVAAKPAAPSDVIIVKHKVANFAKWKTGYESGDSMRTANGLHNYVIARGVDDSNRVMVAMRMDDIAKAKAFAADPALKDAMKKHGVTSTPEIDYVHSVLNDTTAIQQTIRVMIKHKVKDWDTWKKLFDDHKQARMDAGLTDRVISYTVGDNHQVTLVFAVADLAKAKAFMNSKDLADKMKAGGAEGPPSIFFYRVAQKY